MIRLSSLAIVVLGGCSLYTGSQSGNDQWSYCAADGFYQCSGDNCTWVGPNCPSGNGSGYTCTTNNDCAAGCYCGSNGTCTEGGFCTTGADCGPGFHCDTTRSSCEPGCTTDSQCAQGQTCQSSTCTATCTCTSDQQAIAAGYGWCDTTRDTCMTGQNPAGTCGGIPDASCTTAEPPCAAGQVPLLYNGCWNGNCVAYGSCNVPPVCAHINDETDCLNRTDCDAVYDGIDCTHPDGTACHTGDTNCTCKSYVFASCANKTPG